MSNSIYTDITALEWIMIANAGYITYEVTELLLRKYEYLHEVSNLFDSFVVLTGFKFFTNFRSKCISRLIYGRLWMIENRT